ncbi:hypothetical protein LR48_Vigan01g306600 [Vigna angularis]|uniref:Uncharacterized protein n=1 Tax=Phaseolus angularis TaxID=3914 RepID=A0A0L9TSJ9_PHAAN|nr:uncharacterized protein HKW66_Vig0020500 [Vigna angularis]KOM33510.1 hypothetical protein LR48_Vigan01g306600 [Vigna angularis]
MASYPEDQRIGKFLQGTCLTLLHLRLLHHNNFNLNINDKFFFSAILFPSSFSFHQSLYPFGTKVFPIGGPSPPAPLNAASRGDKASGDFHSEPVGISFQGEAFSLPFSKTKATAAAEGRDAGAMEGHYSEGGEFKAGGSTSMADEDQASGSSFQECGCQ